MLIHPRFASQLATQRQREMLAQAHERRLRAQPRAHAAQLPATATTARPCRSWRVRAQTVLRTFAHHPAMRPPAI